MSEIAPHKLQIVLSKRQGLDVILVCNDGHDERDCWLQDAFDDLGADQFMQQYEGDKFLVASVPIQAPVYVHEFSFTTWNGDTDE